LLNWNITSLQIHTVWEETRYGEGVKIAVLDTGIKPDHPEFSTMNVKHYSVLTKDQDASDEKGHGTNCIGVIGAQGIEMLGVAPAAEILAVKIHRLSNDMSTEAVVEGIEWAAQNGAEIISMSFIFSDDFPGLDALHTVIKKYSGTIIFVAAAGNFGDAGEEIHEYPASFPECISVGVLGQNGKRYYTSNTSRYLTLVAPGENIRTTSVKPLYKNVSATSFATPLVSGVFALLLAYTKQNNMVLSSKELINIVKHTCEPIEPGDKLYQYGFGVLNPVKALHILKNYLIL
jgi:subtilisin